MSEGFETDTIEKSVPKVEVGEVDSSKIEIVDTRVTKKGSEQERLNADQIKKLKERIKTDSIQEKLIEYKRLLGPYTKQEDSEGIIVQVRYGKNISGEVTNGELFVDMLTQEEFMAFDKRVITGEKIDGETKEIEYFFDILQSVGTTYSEVALGSVASTVMHESEHTIIDSRPGSQLAIDFENAQPIDRKIVLDKEGHIMSLFDEGITYAFQFAKDGENGLNVRLFEKKQKLIAEGKLSPERKGYLVESRETR